MSEISKNRNVAFDIVRALCILEIVAFWHSLDYMDVSDASSEFFLFGSYLTHGVLSAFAFLSGFFLGKYQFGSFKDVKSFYAKRLKRFWILFFLASTILYVASHIAGDCWYTGPINFINSLLGLTVFFGPQPATLWFMCMTMFFYIITPLLKVRGRGLFFSILIIVIIAFLTYYFGIDNRTILYLPIYVCGLYFNKNYIDKLYNKKSIMVILCLLAIVTFVVCCYVANIKVDNIWINFVVAISVTTFLIIVGRFIEQINLSVVNNIFEKISFASLCMYLFHRHFYLFLVFLYCGSLSEIRTATLPVWVIELICVPIIIIGSYWIQRIYDRFTNKVWR